MGLVWGTEAAEIAGFSQKKKKTSKKTVEITL